MIESVFLVYTQGKIPEEDLLYVSLTRGASELFIEHERGKYPHAKVPHEKLYEVREYPIGPQNS